jgi:hypothetical protein
MNDHPPDSLCPDEGGAWDGDGRTAPCADSLADLERKKIVQYRQQSLEQTDPFRAALGGASGTLMGVLHRYHGTLDRGMGPEPSPDRLRKLRPDVEVFLKLARQIDRFAQLELRHFRSPAAASANSIPAPSQGEESNI